MSRKINYRKQLLRAVEAFLEGTPASLTHAQQIIGQCYNDLHTEIKATTLDRFFWDSFIVPLTDSVYYEDRAYLQEMRSILLGDAAHISLKTGIGDDYQAEFTADETAWYAHLLEMVEFLRHIPFEQIHQATSAARQQRDTWMKIRGTIPAVLQAEEAEKEYQQRKEAIEAIAARTPPPKNIGDEKIYHLVLREVTLLVTSIHVGEPAIHFGYPILRPPYSGLDVDLSASIAWAKRALDALSGKGGILITWCLSPAPGFGADLLIVSLH